MRKLSLFDLISVSILVLVAIFSAARFNTLPQFIDGYYHLSVANGFIKSGGWTGWAWWDFAPFGRPHLYPPLYHFVLVFLVKSGISGLCALRLTEIMIVPAFFSTLWFVARKLIDDKFAFLSLIITSSFFTFYSSVSANIPASLAIIFGLLTWFFLEKKKALSAIIFMSLCFYSHAGIPWIFFISLIFLSIFNHEYRKLSFRTAIASVLVFIPFLLHELWYIKSVHLTSLYESRFVSFNVLAILCALISIYYNRRNRDFAIIAFWGYLLGSALIFFKYPYRFFSSQGFLGAAFFSALLLSVISGRIINRQKIFLIAVSLYLFFINATIGMPEGKIKFNIFDSTFYNLVAKKAYDDVAFKSVFSEKFYLPIIESIRQNSSVNEIISSNVPVAAQIFSSLSNRPSSTSMLGEVQPENKLIDSGYAKLVILIKPITKEDVFGLKDGKLNLIFENEIAYILLDKDPLRKEFARTAPFKFLYVYLVLVSVLLLVIYDNIYTKKP